MGPRSWVAGHDRRPVHGDRPAGRRSVGGITVTVRCPEVFWLNAVRFTCAWWGATQAHLDSHITSQRHYSAFEWSGDETQFRMEWKRSI